MWVGGCRACACVCTNMWRPEIYTSSLPEKFSTVLSEYIFSMKLGLAALAFGCPVSPHILLSLVQSSGVTINAVDFHGSARNPNLGLLYCAAGTSPSSHLQELED